MLKAPTKKELGKEELSRLIIEEAIDMLASCISVETSPTFTRGSGTRFTYTVGDHEVLTHLPEKKGEDGEVSQVVVGDIALAIAASLLTHEIHLRAHEVPLKELYPRVESLLREVSKNS